MKVAVVGSRTMKDYARFSLEMECFLRLWGPFTVVSGGARGADYFAAKWAKEKGLELEVFLPDWQRNPGSAGFIRNRAIVDAAEAVVAFWDGVSGGTAYTVSYAKKKGRKVYLLPSD